MRPYTHVARTAAEDTNNKFLLPFTSSRLPLTAAFLFSRLHVRTTERWRKNTTAHQKNMRSRRVDCTLAEFWQQTTGIICERSYTCQICTTNALQADSTACAPRHSTRCSVFCCEHFARLMCWLQHLCLRRQTARVVLTKANLHKYPRCLCAHARLAKINAPLLLKTPLCNIPFAKAMLGLHHCHCSLLEDLFRVVRYTTSCLLLFVALLDVSLL